MSETIENVDHSKSFVEHHYIRLKLHYFLSHACLASFNPVLDIILDHRGLTFIEISLINLLVPFLIFFINPLLGYIADHSRRFRLTFNVIFTLSSILLLVAFLLPSIKTSDIQGELHFSEEMEYSMRFCANEEFARKCTLRKKCGCFYQAKCISLNTLNQSKQRLKEKIFYLNFTMNEEDIKEQSNNLLQEKKKHSICERNYRVSIKEKFNQTFEKSKKTSKLANCQIKCSSKHVCDGTRYTNEIYHIILYGILVILARTFFHNSMTIGTSIGFAIIDHSNLFGRQRVWGTIGSGLTAFLASRLYHHYKTDYIYISTFIITSVLTILITCFIRIPSNQLQENDISQREYLNPNEEKEKKKKESHLVNVDAILLLLKKKNVCIFLLTTLVWGMSFAVLDPYLLMYIDETSPCEAHSIAGYLSLIASIFEMIALFISHRFLRYFRMKMSTILIFLAFSIRFFGYYFISQPYFYLPLEITHFFNFGILFVLISEEAFQFAPLNLVGTLQGLVNGISFGLGHGIGLLICLLISRKMKERDLFLVFAIINLVGALFYLVYCLCNKICSKSSPSKASKEENVEVWREVKSEAEKNLNEEIIL